MLRADIAFRSHGTICRGWHYSAEGAGPRPCVVMAHGLAGVKEMRLDAFAERFAEVGYDAVVFDYRHLGASDGAPRQRLDIRRQLEDYHAAIAFARALPGIDAGRIVLWGTSLSGGHAITAAVKDRRVAAVVAQTPHVDALRTIRALGLRHGARLTLHGIADLLGRSLGRAPHLLPAAGAPGTLAILTAPEAMEHLALIPEGMAFEGSVAAGVVLQIAGYSPARHLKGVRVPVLVQVGLGDQCTPPGAAIAAARSAPNAVLRTYDCGHFGPYLGTTFERFVADQIAFLADHVPARLPIAA
jgi:pimeloyl-ACP methyl ester carboxylesterase